MLDLREALAATTDEQVVDAAALPDTFEFDGPRPVVIENIDD